VTVTLLDPCDPPQALTQLDLENKEYTITQTADNFQHAGYNAFPPYCPVQYSYVIPLFINGE